MVRLLGAGSDMRARLAAIAEEHGFPTAFPDEALRQAGRMSEPDEADFAGREDLRGRMLFTIDGPFSKDFDDAVSLERAEDGSWLLGVHIADVSHYVRPGSPIDREAQKRGTSLYLPGLTVAMLPEALSDDLCSLMPNADRLAMSLIMTCLLYTSVRPPSGSIVPACSQSQACAHSAGRGSLWPPRRNVQLFLSASCISSCPDTFS